MNFYINFDPAVDEQQDVIDAVNKQYGDATAVTETSTTESAAVVAAKKSGGDPAIDIAAQVKTFAEKNDVDISQLTGTGKRGKIIRADVVNFINARDVDLDPLGDDPVTRDQVRAALKEYASLESKTAAIQILKDNGSSSIGELEESNFQAVIDACSL